ncbi:MAG: hypothetical protein A3F13_00540 [Gammaproteobacteria bacterium RIFCSPHIGHO2_12_FULL_40_19]|nr:MAG: hypothetical protein A3F13_00540 [Gammaproteobacteria bacterium RIFCSPHIGHO2_12_FULL_40_19]
MREFAKISPQFWISEQGRQIKQLGVDAQLLAFYLQSSPNSTMIGIYYLPIAFIMHELAMSYERVEIALHLLNTIDYCSYDAKSEYVWVHDMAFWQIETSLKENDHRVKGIINALEMLPGLPFLDAYYEKYTEAFHLERDEGAQEGLASKEKENREEIKKIENEKDKAERILNFFIVKTGKNYRINEDTLSPIITRLRSGVSERKCFQLIANKTRRWKGHEVMDEHLKIETLFGSKFEKYLADLPKESQLPEESDLPEDEIETTQV